MNDQEKLTALKTYFDLMSMNGGARIYRTAQEVGIFKALASDAKTASEVAEICGLKERPVQVLLDALCGLRIMSSDNGIFTLTPVMGFLAGNYSNLSDEYWDHLPELLKTGEPMAKMDSAEQSEEQYTKQVTALAWMMKAPAEVAAQILDIGGSRKELSILDVGAGSAVWSLTLASKDAASKVTALDWPAVLKIAEATALQMGLGDRFEMLPGNYHETEIPQEAYDLAIVANVSHIETPEGNTALLKKLHSSLKPGGEVIIIDVLPGQPEGDLSRGLYALGLALRTEMGQVYTCQELSGFLTAAGFTDVSFSPIPVTPSTMGMVIGKKGN